MHERRLAPPFDRLYEQEIALLTSARATLAQMDQVSAADREKLADMIQHLDQLFMLVVVGEFNSGKSSLINALLQDDYLPVGILPTTSQITILRHGEAKRNQGEDSLVILTHPADILREMSIVDTPGTNAVLRQHERLAREFIHRSDFVFFVMSATHAFAETDRLYLELIREYGAKVVIVLNQIDLLSGESEIRQVTEFIRRQSIELLHFEPKIVPVSAKWAADARQIINLPRRRKLLAQSGIPQLVEFISAALNQEARLREKLNTPLRVTQAILARYRTDIVRQLGLLAEDFAVIADIEAQERAYRETIEARLHSRLDPIERVFAGMEQRGKYFINENLQIGRLTQLINRQEFQTRFEQAVIGDAPTVITGLVNQIITDLIAEDRKQWERTLQSLRQMLVRHRDRVVGSVEGEFIGSLETFAEHVRQAERALARYSRQDAADSLRDIQLGALVDTVVTGVTALVGGVILVTVLDDLVRALLAIKAGSAISAILGPAGWAIGGAAALSGSFLLVNRRLPRARQEARENLAKQIAALQRTFREALMASATKEFALFRSHVYDSLAPVEQYLIRLRNELEELQAKLEGLLGEIARLQGEIEEK